MSSPGSLFLIAVLYNSIMAKLAMMDGEGFWNFYRVCMIAWAVLLFLYLAVNFGEAYRKVRERQRRGF